MWETAATATVGLKNVTLNGMYPSRHSITIIAVERGRGRGEEPPGDVQLGGSQARVCARPHTDVARPSPSIRAT